jgi:hypothetical protein
MATSLAEHTSWFACTFCEHPSGCIVSAPALADIRRTRGEDTFRRVCSKLVDKMSWLPRISAEGIKILWQDTVKGIEEILDERDEPWVLTRLTQLPREIICKICRNDGPLNWHLALFGPKGTGKSSLYVAVLLYVLFGKWPAGTENEDLEAQSNRLAGSREGDQHGNVPYVYVSTLLE